MNTPCMLLIYLLVKLYELQERISGQQKQPGSFILQAEPLSRSYHVAESICRINNIPFSKPNILEFTVCNSSLINRNRKTVH